ncbi:hypothetical protein QBC40DRAFT_20375 [Triangularia verruculosa]|uniref:Uncharacterized protein n=1 Tax=Triangularia verruculosa TaxID=2587418 RepID=A0AAN6XRZ1_9PEZI|nr:hypothetical protein QBC40DRAFT_20375 [Triangularia verruculosa]
MASPDVAAPNVNGVAAASSRADSPADSINSSTKRKRDANDHHRPEDDTTSKPPVNGLQKCHDDQSLIRDFFDVLQSHDKTTPAILKRHLPGPAPDGVPSLKRAKSEEDEPITIADKVAQGAYRILDDLMCDLTKVVEDHVKELKMEDGASNEGAITQTKAFKTTALGLYRQELSYPKLPQSLPLRPGQREDGSDGTLVLSTFGLAPNLRPLFTSLQRSASPDGVLKPLGDGQLPNGVTATKIYPDVYAHSDKNARPLTLGELFPSPRNLPPLQPPKAPKNTTKSNVLSFYHPELTEKSKYRSGTYSSQSLSTGHWLDYSNATPAIHAKTKQRERAQSLAGVKPSSVELELSEMEALFRGAFSSFAPSRDDSAAIVPSSLISRIWWQRVGRRNFEKMNEDALDEKEEENAVEPGFVTEIDDDLVKEAIENWDSVVDPSLDEVLGKKSDEEKEVEDLLDEVTDMIETLSSFQRNRNLTLPTSQDRYSADPNNGDMLRNGNASQQPSEEEVMTYEALKAQLAMIIASLPPYAVARLNSDKLEELAVSTKIEVRSDEYRGVMEEDEPARLSRQAAQAAANASQRQAHRTPSVSSATYGNHQQQYPGQFQPSARPIANAQHFPQTPVRPQGQNMFPRAPSTVPIPQPHHQVQPRQPPPTQYRPGPGPQMYAPQLAKAQGPYGHSNMPQPYVNSPTQQRMPQPPPPQHNFMGQQGTPRFPQQNFQQNFPQHQQIHPPHQQHPQHQQVPHHQPLAQHPPQHPHNQQHTQHGQQAPFPPYANGGPMQRTISPQIPQQNPYGQSPTPPQQHQQIPHGRPPYGPSTPGVPPSAMQQRPYPGSPSMMQGGNRPPSSLTGFATVMPEVQQRQVMEQARARADAEQRVSGHMGKVAQGEVVGLAGIGLGGQMDVHKMAAANKLQIGSPGPKMAMHQPSPTPPLNGTQTPVPIPHVPSPMQGVVPTPSPGPQGPFVKPPVP